MTYFDYCTDLKMTNRKFDALFGGPPRTPETDLTQREMDLAASIQSVTEEVVIKLARDIAKTTGQKNLCLAGVVALNCVANGKLLKEKIFEQYERLDSARDRKAGGSGIGLALCRTVITSLGGTIEARNLNPGFEIRIRLLRHQS